ncbi:MAG: hypothetical protein Q7U04_13565 [Bacteriovorax sp.]|nr:hypothetical protein [Bacteriovorax sp.]
MELIGYFNDFLSEIRLPIPLKTELIEAHTKLTKLLSEDDSTKNLIVTTFLQGSYRRGTIIKPANDQKSDVDVVVVTNIDHNIITAVEAIKHFEKFAKKHYENNYQLQSKSIGLIDGNIELDLVITALPIEGAELYKSDKLRRLGVFENIEDTVQLSNTAGFSYTNDFFKSLIKSDEYESWKSEPIKILDKDKIIWVVTNPIAQILWTLEKNKKTDGHYINVVKCMKWWKRINANMPKHPKGYPIEHLFGYYAPEKMSSVADGIVKTLQKIVAELKNNYETSTVPKFEDHGVKKNVWERIDIASFKKFYEQVCFASEIAQKAYSETSTYESAKLWNQLLGEEFDVPPEPTGGARGGFTGVTGPSDPPGGRFG